MSVILRHGDLVSPGRYRCHSRFARAANYLCDDRVLSLVSAEVGAGPLVLVVGLREIHSVEVVTVTEDGVVFLDGERHELCAEARYDSRIELPAARERGRLCDNVAAAAQLVVERGHPKSWAFLLDPTRPRVSAGRFEAALEARVVARVGELLAEPSPAALSGLRGLGLGLTPSGDDFLCGYLHAQHLRARLGIARFEPDALPPALFAGGDLLTRSFLRCAAAGAVTEPVKELLRLLAARPTGEALGRAVARVLRMGATSGADWATGLCLALSPEMAPSPQPWLRGRDSGRSAAELGG